MSVPGEFRRIGTATIARLRLSEHAALRNLARELEDVSRVTDGGLSAAASRVLALCEGARSGMHRAPDPAQEHLEAETGHLLAVCRAILGHA